MMRYCGLHKFFKTSYWMSGLIVLSKLVMSPNQAMAATPPAYQEASYTKAELTSAQDAGARAGLAEVLLPQLVVKGQVLMRTTTDSHAALCLEYTGFTVRESNRFMPIEGATVQLPVRLSPGTDGTWLTWDTKRGKQHVMSFVQNGVYIVIIPNTGQGLAQTVVERIADSFTPVTVF